MDASPAKFRLARSFWRATNTLAYSQMCFLRKKKFLHPPSLLLFTFLFHFLEDCVMDKSLNAKSIFPHLGPVQ
jgi:hypothetical protein